MGRLPILFTLEPLSEDTLVRILQEPKNAILKQYEKLLAMDEVKLAFDEDALRAIAHKAKEKVGARALRAVIEEFMLDIMYEDSEGLQHRHGHDHEGLCGRRRAVITPRLHRYWEYGESADCSQQLIIWNK